MPLFGRKSVEPEHQRKRIYSEDEIKERLESMDPEMQNTFIRLAEMLMHKESQMFLDIVAKSRQDIQEVGDSIKEEQEVLKTTAKVLARERNGAEGLEYADIEEDEAPTKVHFESEYNKKVVQDYLKAVGRDVPSRSTEVQKRRNYKLAKTDANGYVPEYARRVGSATPKDRPYTASSSGSRPGTAYRMRMGRQDDEDVAATGGAAAAVATSWHVEEPRRRERTMEEEAKVKEEKEELMEQMKMMDNMMQGEKERQEEALKARKEARKARKEQKKADEETQAMELLETNQEAEEQKRKSKERQEQILKERLAKKRLERRKTLQDMAVEEPDAHANHVPAGERAQELELELGITRAKTSVAPQEEQPAEAERPKKKGKKKQQEAAPPPPPVEANWDVGGADDEAAGAGAKKGKKKKKKEAQPAESAEAPAAEEGKKKKKKKKATAAEPPADTVLDLEAGDGTGERKKKGKKKLSEDLDLAVSEV